MMWAGTDLGNIQTKSAIPDEHGNPVILETELGAKSWLSVVYFDEGRLDKVLFGDEAVNAGLAHPEWLVMVWKRFIGTDDVRCTLKDGMQLKAKDIARILLSKVCKDFERQTGGILTEVGLSIPANYNDKQRQEMIDAAAALNVKVHITHEPTAAALGNGVHKRGDGLYLIVDVGGGTTDVSLIKVEGNIVSILGTNGNNQLGGMDFNARLEELFLEKLSKGKGIPKIKENALAYADFRQRVEQAKRVLSKLSEASISFSLDGKLFQASVTRDEFEARCADLVKAVGDLGEQTLRETTNDVKDVKDILGVGGAAMAPMVGDMIEKRFGKKVSYHCEALFAAAKGNVILARQAMEGEGRTAKVGNYSLPPLEQHTKEVTSHDVGILVLRDGSENDEVNALMLPKGTPIPHCEKEMFKLVEDGQTAARIVILQGPHGAPAKECLQLGHFELKDLPKIQGEPHRIEIAFEISKNGILSAIARCVHSDKFAKMEIDYRKAVNGGANGL
ncbi:MAG: Hsp70 family protein [Planctomycetota bacterium]